jgi:hypothetical protein
MGPTNKENMPVELGIMPPEPEEATIQEATRVNQSLTTWTSEALEEAWKQLSKVLFLYKGLVHY